VQQAENETASAASAPSPPGVDPRGAPVDLARVSALLQADPVWCAYALADLQPAFLPHCRWYLADDTGMNGSAQAHPSEDAFENDGLLLLFTLLQPPILITMGSVDAVASALARAHLPDHVYLNVRVEHLPLVEVYYDVPNGPLHMRRMKLERTPSSPFTPHPQLVRLTRADVERMHALYAHGGPFTPDAFDFYQIENGVFFGIEDRGGDLLAAGGTHIVDPQQGIAAIGNMYTHPARRGCGLGGAILQALLAEFAARSWGTVVLNVDQRNMRAQRLYERHGFQVHCPFIEGIGRKRVRR
jgi:ribosomal protein S18 acetylase RimI-like enzyme